MSHYLSLLNSLRENTKFQFQQIDESVSEDHDYLEKSAIVSVILE
jgi:hypothetical protein